MNAARAVRLLQQDCFIVTPDGLVQGEVVDVVAAYGAIRLAVRVPEIGEGGVVWGRRKVDAHRVVIRTTDADSNVILTPALEY